MRLATLRRLVRRYVHADLARRYTVAQAYSGADAVIVAEQRAPDLILLDLILEDGGGEEILERLRAVVGLADTPTPIVSAQELLAGRLALGERFAVHKSDGLRRDERCRAVEALVTALEPPRRYVSAAATGTMDDAPQGYAFAARPN